MLAPQSGGGRPWLRRARSGWADHTAPPGTPSCSAQTHPWAHAPCVNNTEEINKKEYRADGVPSHARLNRTVRMLDLSWDGDRNIGCEQSWKILSGSPMGYESNSKFYTFFLAKKIFKTFLSCLFLQFGFTTYLLKKNYLKPAITFKTNQIWANTRPDLC